MDTHFQIFPHEVAFKITHRLSFFSGRWSDLFFHLWREERERQEAFSVALKFAKKKKYFNPPLVIIYHQTNDKSVIKLGDRMLISLEEDILDTTHTLTVSLTHTFSLLNWSYLRERREMVKQVLLSFNFWLS